MERQDYIAQIKFLSDTVSQFRDMISYLKVTHVSDVVEKAKFQTLITSLTDEVHSLREELAKRNDRNDGHNKQAFGKSSLKSTTRKEGKTSHGEEKQDFSTPDSLSKEVPVREVTDVDVSKVQSDPLDGKRGLCGPYNPMNATMVKVLECNAPLIPSGMKLLGSKYVDEIKERRNRRDVKEILFGL